ncbi:perlucin-like protein [Mytilus galloprovincialis]|uniref:perlucin-like protein n=1 Tax=Mytilus galloprovincialis TaxID=29158 RepID=UPI003F7C9B04
MYFIVLAAMCIALAHCMEINWKTYKGMEYALVTTQMTWIEAQRYCSQYGGVLAQPENSDINKYLKSLTDKKTWLWIGASNLPDKKTWEWHNPLKAITFTDWQSSQPNAYSTENCMLYWKSSEGYKWGDYYCNRKYGFICQRKDSNCNGKKPTHGNECEDKKPTHGNECEDKRPSNQKCMTICL